MRRKKNAETAESTLFSETQTRAVYTVEIKNPYDVWEDVRNPSYMVPVIPSSVGSCNDNHPLMKHHRMLTYEQAMAVAWAIRSQNADSVKGVRIVGYEMQWTVKANSAPVYEQEIGGD